MIRTDAEQSIRTVTLRITDEGIGIAQEHIDQLFERFRRPGAPSGVRGMGLGLYLSKHLVEAQGGVLAVSSAGPGLGSTFAITLPIATGWDASEKNDPCTRSTMLLWFSNDLK